MVLRQIQIQSNGRRYFQFSIFFGSLSRRKLQSLSNDLAVDDPGGVPDAHRFAGCFDATRHHRAERRAHTVRAVVLGKFHSCKGDSV